MLGLTHLVSPLPAAGQMCAPPGPPGTPRVWRRDCRPIRPRRPASTLTTAETQKLRDAYMAMRALDTSDPNDPRGFARQAEVHCWNCGHGTQVHGSWRFFAWHRAYLYFHEQILGALVNDAEFRLPYWDWDNAAHRRIPPAYTNPGNNSNSLWNPSRVLGPTQDVPDEDVGELVMNGVMTLGTFAEFGGTAALPGSPEGIPHGAVHIDVGGDMGFFDSAANDPVFYAHHSNVDKLWSDWNRSDVNHTNPSDPAFRDLMFTFYDANKQWVSIKASQVLDHEASLRYEYGRSRFAEILPCILDWIVVRSDWRTARTLTLSPTIQRALSAGVASKSPIRLHVDELVVPADTSAVYRLYIGRREAESDAGPSGSGYLGSVAFVANDAKGAHNRPRPVRAVIDVTKAAPGLLQRQVGGELFLVSRGAKSGTTPAPVIALRARDVYFSVAKLS